MAGKIIQRPELEGGFTVGGTEIVSATGVYKGVISTTNITATGNTVIGDASSDTLTLVATTTGTAPITNTVTSTSATPSNVRSLIGAVVDATTVTSGLLTGVRGIATIASASGGFVYGTQGKLAVTGTLSGSVWAAGLFGQLDMSAATTNAGQVAAIWGDWGATSGTETSMTGARGIAMTNTTDAVLNAQMYLYGSATNLLELAGPGGTMAFVTGSNGSGADVYLTISINGVPAKIAAKYV
jgi:hypothetical protein